MKPLQCKDFNVADVAEFPYSDMQPMVFADLGDRIGQQVKISPIQVLRSKEQAAVGRGDSRRRHVAELPGPGDRQPSGVRGLEAVKTAELGAIRARLLSLLNPTLPPTRPAEFPIPRERGILHLCD